jgi:hypothetical protein
MKLIMEGWRDFLGKARKKLKPEEEENEPSSLVKALMKRGNLTRKQAEAMAKRRVDLEESDDLLARVSSDLSNK